MDLHDVIYGPDARRELNKPSSVDLTWYMCGWKKSAYIDFLPGTHFKSVVYLFSIYYYCDYYSNLFISFFREGFYKLKVLY